MNSEKDLAILTSLFPPESTASENDAGMMLRLAGELFELHGHRTEGRSHHDLGGFEAPLDGQPRRSRGQNRFKRRRKDRELRGGLEIVRLS